MRSLSNDLGESASLLESVDDMEFAFTPDGVKHLAQSLRNFERRAATLEDHLRSAHLSRVIAETGDSAADIERELAIIAGVEAGIVVDLREVFADELEFNGRPAPGRHPGRHDDGDAA